MDRIDLTWTHFLFPPVNREGIRFVLAAGGVALLLHSLFIWLGHPLVALLFWVLPVGVYYFFRDPERVPPLDADAVVSPADGTVCRISQEPIPEQLGLDPCPIVWRVSVFMSVFNVHVNRMPAEGIITKTHYVPGETLNASLDKASEANERQLYLMAAANGQQIAFVQIAGLVARRIVSLAQEGQRLARAERFGLIRFGSRVDVYLPQGVEPAVRVGQTMVAGETVIARLTQPTEPRA
ncbi:MAG: phosphatidylserine decarboxylase [Kiritimatiellaeota bacterium]|nr:phosphatidylserine decarboxylase [Kiritimatiellota bacterium]